MPAKLHRNAQEPRYDPMGWSATPIILQDKFHFLAVQMIVYGLACCKII